MRPLVFALAVLLALPAATGSAAEDLQALIDAAEPGSVITLQGGTYIGNVVIDKPLTITGVGWPTVDGRGAGNVITIEATDVTIEGMVIANTGSSLANENAGISANAPRVRILGNRFENVLFGVFLREASDSVVADNVVGSMPLDEARRGDGIRLWESSRSLVENNVVDGGRDTVLWFSDDLILRGNRVTNGRYGIHFMYSDRALIDGNYLSGNSVGGFLMYSRDLVMTDNVISGSHGPSGYGIGLKDMDVVEIRGNHLIGNRVGVYLDNSPSTPGIEHTISGNVFAHNQVGLLFQPSVEGNVVSGNAFIDNGEQVGVSGKGVFAGNVWTADGVGNHWSDYAGYDAAADGYGDVTYRLDDLFSSFTDDHPRLHFFDQTPAARAVDLAGHMFPAIRPRPKVADTAPLIEPPDIPLPPIAMPAPGSMLPSIVTAAALLSMAALLVSVARRSPLRRPS